MDLKKDEYLKKLDGRKIANKGKQATYHQQLAVETAEKLNDMASLGLYLRIFRVHKLQLHKLIECRGWVLRVGKGANLGRLFVSAYKKFLG